MNTITTTLNFSGLTCEACAKLLKRRLEKIEGISEANVSEEGTANITSSKELDLNEISESIKDTDYKLIN